MKTKKMFSKVLAAALAVLMLVGMIPVFASAADASTDAEGLHLNKEATLADDGTYTIQLDAYADGVVSSTEEHVPLDIVLVIDQSGSMGYAFTYNTEDIEFVQYDGSYYNAYSTEVYHKCVDGEMYPLNVTRTWKTAGYNYVFACAQGENGGQAEGCPFGSHQNHCFLAGFAQGPNYTGPFSGQAKEWGPLLFKMTTGTTETTRVEALKGTLNEFVAAVREDANTNSVNHKIAIVGFGSQSGNGNNTEILTVEGSNTTVSQGAASVKEIGVAYDNLTNTQYSSALVAHNASIVDDAISALAASGATRSDLGMEMAKNILATETDANRKKVVILFTDGVPTSSSSFDETVAGDAIEHAYAMKSNNTDIYSVGIFDDASAAKLIAEITGTTDADRSNIFMHAASTNYPNATTWGSYGDPGSKLGYYMVASDSAQLNGVFESIAQTVTGSAVTLTGEAVLKDYIADEFVFPDTANINVQVADWNGSSFGTAYTPDASLGITAAYNEADHSVSVTGFDYSNQYCVAGISGGKKLIVTITGIEGTEDAITGELVYTNKEASGVYKNSTAGAAVENFPMPEGFVLNKASFVLDYAKEASLDVSTLFNSITGIDGATDEIMNGSYAWPSNGIIDETYGKLVNNNGLKYTPQTMQWNGYDSFYVFGKNTAGANAWNKISVLPANNVYYEDTFVSQDADGNDTGLAGITYTGDWTEVKTENENENTETPNSPVHGGWVEGDPGLSNDTGYSDGTAYTSSSAGATAKFSFTGTGFDIYGRTNGKTGTVLVQVKDTATQISKYMVVDCLAESGDYYQIPTLWFSAPNHGTFEVTITVTAAAGERLEYYLDGIKIYNPMDTTGTTDETIGDAYGEELDARFASIRDFLLDQGSFDGLGDTAVEGALFIDRVMVGEPGDSTANYENALGVYESYGPENEVYLGSGQKVAFNIGMPNTVIEIGMKAPDGATEASVTYGTADGPVKAVQAIEHSTDLFYKVMSDANGNVVIENSGDKLLSLTKIKLIVNGADEEAEIAAVTVDEMIAVVNEFDALPVMAYSLAAAPAEPEAPVEPETPVEPEQPTEPEEPTVPSGPSVEIENPELPAEPIVPDMELIQEQVKQFVSKLFNAFRGWFGR